MKFFEIERLSKFNKRFWVKDLWYMDEYVNHFSIRLIFNRKLQENYVYPYVRVQPLSNQTNSRVL